MAVFCFLTAVSAQDRSAPHSRQRSFCSNDNYSSDRVQFRETREMAVPAAGTLTVDGGQNGGISVSGENRSDVLVRACVQTWGSSDADAKALAQRIRIDTAGTIKADAPVDDKNWSVSYQISVPRSSNIDLTAHNGGIAISGVDGTIRFETTNGGVHLGEVSGDVKGRTTNGGVHVDLSGGSWKGSGLDVETTNGGVHLSMPANYAAHVETGTVNGGFSSDIQGLSVDRRDRSRTARISTDLNGGGAPIRLFTTNGGIHISSDRSSL
jgi:DUF4097 and DUF4098 domain-containing protein YvlB